MIVFLINLDEESMAKILEPKDNCINSLAIIKVLK